MKQYNYCAIALGSNAFDTANKIQPLLMQVLSRIRKENLNILKKSSFFSTPAFPKGSDPDFVNSVVLLETSFTAYEILAKLHMIEADFGRIRTKRWGQRVIDLDLLFYNNEILPTRFDFEYWLNLPFEAQLKEAPKQLILPHPRLQDRGFVLVPLAEVAPDWIHPVLKITVLEMLEKFETEDIKSIVKL